MNLQEYVQLLYDLIDEQDGNSIAKLISFKNKEIKKILFQISYDFDDVADQFNLFWEIDDENDDELKTLINLRNTLVHQNIGHKYLIFNNPIKAYPHFSDAFKFYKRALEKESPCWSLPILSILSNQLRLVAISADRAGYGLNDSNSMYGTSGSNAAAQRDSISSLRLILNVLNARSSSNRIKGLLNLLNTLLRIYFRLGQIENCISAIHNFNHTLNARGIKIDTFPISQLVTFKYFQGRISILQQSYKDAEKSLSWAFQHCSNRYQSNKRLILELLIPTRLIFGKIPPQEMLIDYNFKHYQDIITCIRTGNINLFNQILDNYQDQFIDKGLFLIIEKLRPLIYRSLFVEISKYCIVSGKIIEFKNVKNIFDWMELDIELAEVECIIANLIYQGLIKGYISHKKSLIVIGKKDPFPSFSVVQNKIIK
eukprot:TRINITY_DN4820_c0_g1_i1.p1 TRINITY_DN4820_c0_g1~~TRINITY_DN4820_c0_g1_i1.p1  ORF type:complete len:427 (+),score=68.57 TRINITY_DN4820_c0_g1_i1:54-1334(+)